MHIPSVNTLDEEFVWSDKAGLVTQMLGAAAGSAKLYANIDLVPPKAYSAKYHSHSQQEEFFLILEGSGILRLNGEELSVKEGDFFAKPAGQGIAHTFYNPGGGVLKILDVGTVEPEDTCCYPDEDMVMHKAGGERFVFHKGACQTGWTSEPNGQAAD